MTGLENESPENDGPTVSGSVQICNQRGLHARASARFVRMAEGFDADITVRKDGVAVCGTSIMGLMMLAAAAGDRIEISAVGTAAAVAVKDLTSLVIAKFHEE